MKPEEIARFMEGNDRVAKSYEMKVKEVKEGYSLVELQVNESMLNAAGVCQGGVIFSLADFAFAVASNSYGNVALATSANINFVKPAFNGEKLTAEAVEVSKSKRIGVYRVEVKKEDGTVVALFVGQAYFLDKPILEESKR